MKPILRRRPATTAALACILTIGAALFPRDPAPGSDSADLRVAPASYRGELFSNTQPSLQGEFFSIKVTNVVGNKLSGIGIKADMEGSVTTTGKLKAKIVVPKAASTGVLGRGGPVTLGTPGLELTLKGQLSEGGNAII